MRGREDQELCLYLGAEVGLDMAAITVAAVTQARCGDNLDMVRLSFTFLFSIVGTVLGVYNVTILKYLPVHFIFRQLFLILDLHNICGK